MFSFPLIAVRCSKSMDKNPSSYPFFTVCFEHRLKTASILPAYLQLRLPDNPLLLNQMLVQHEDGNHLPLSLFYSTISSIPEYPIACF